MDFMLGPFEQCQSFVDPFVNDLENPGFVSCSLSVAATLQNPDSNFNPFAVSAIDVVSLV